jgi:hypothetical protein
MHTSTETTTIKASLDALNSFVRGELSAVETYRMALDKITEEPMRNTLEEALRSHRTRVQDLRAKIIDLGGTPSESSGAWGAFAKAVTGSAKVFGVKAAIAALEEGEDHGLADYKRDLEKLDGDLREFVIAKILPAQEASHRIVSDLKHSLH